MQYRFCLSTKNGIAILVCTLSVYSCCTVFLNFLLWLGQNSCIFVLTDFFKFVVSGHSLIISGPGRTDKFLSVVLSSLNCTRYDITGTIRKVVFLSLCSSAFCFFNDRETDFR